MSENVLKSQFNGGGQGWSIRDIEIADTAARFNRSERRKNERI